MNVSAIILAAGSGRRLRLNQPKAFVKLGGYPMIRYSLFTLAGIPAITEAVITIPNGMEVAARHEVAKSGLGIPVKLTPGGVERQDSVRIALALTSAESELVIVHDAARPLAQAQLFDACLAAALRSGGAIAATPVADTLKRVSQGAIIATPFRDNLYQAQTPQAFRRDLLVAAHEQAVRAQMIATDDAELVERLGGRVEIVESSSLNLKVTTPSDLEMAQALAKASPPGQPAT